MLPIQSNSKYLLVLFLFLTKSTIAQTYQWTDSEGKTHFGDRPPQSELSQAINLPQIQSLKFTEVKVKLKRINKTTRKSKKPTMTQCQKIKQSINKLEKALTKRQKASEFDKNNQNLIQLRWRKRKHC